MTVRHLLSDRTLDRHATRVAVPSYDRSALTPSVVHLSVGYFHRAHQAVYFDDLARRGCTEWGLTGVGLRRREMRDALRPQDGLYTVVERGAERDRARIVGVMGRYLFAPEEPEAVLSALVDERTRLVTLTITGVAYHVDPATGHFDTDADEVRADVARGRAPRSALGMLVEALDARRRAGLAPFTLMSCDNISANGDVTRRAVTSFAALRDERLAEWIAEHVAFPNSMVDRITPKTTAADRERIAREFGVVDRWPVTTEPFSDWVAEDSFCNGRPPLDEVGVRFVGDVRPYATIKTRLLNAAHLAVGSLGRLAGHATMHEALADPVVRFYTEDLIEREIAPLLPDIPGFDLPAYQRSVMERLANPKIGDQLERLCRSGSIKLPRHIVPSVLAARREGRPDQLLTLAVAGWCRQLGGLDDRGEGLEVDDPAADRLRPSARRGADPAPLLADGTIFGPLVGDAGFAAALRDALATLDRLGARGAMAAVLGGERLAA